MGKGAVYPKPKAPESIKKDLRHLKFRPGWSTRGPICWTWVEKLKERAVGVQASYEYCGTYFLAADFSNLCKILGESLMQDKIQFKLKFRI